MTNPDTEKAALIAEIEAARARVASSGADLREEGEKLRKRFDIPGRTRESFEKNRPAWLGGAALIGLILSKIPARKKTVFVEQATGTVLGAAGKLGAVWTAVKFAGGIAKPFIGEAVAKWVASRVEKTNPPPDEPPRAR